MCISPRWAKLSGFQEILRDTVRSFWTPSSAQVEALEAHFELLQRWNKRLNLTTIRDLREIVERHYGESLFLGSQLPAGALRIVDIGSGAGFPGFPIAVARVECKVSLVESHRRKAVFLQEASRSILNIRVLAARIQDVVGEFDWAVCRAVKWNEIRFEALRLAEHAAVLGGDGGIKLPWGDNRYLRVVSRGT
jgi:16S rRNA (guanine527-N7)-methyltransferase